MHRSLPKNGGLRCLTPTHHMIRSWKQRFDPKAKFIFLKRMKFSDYIAMPGDPVPQELVDARGTFRMKVWWNGGFIGLAPTPPPATMKHLGAGVYLVNIPGQEPQRVHGKENAQSLMGLS